MTAATWLNSDALALAQAFVTSLGLGLLVGLERERKGDSRGLRTFALTCLLGTLVAVIAKHTANTWLVPSGLMAITAVAISAFWPRSADAEPTATSVVALVFTFCLGLAAGGDLAALAVPLAVVATALLYFKSELRGFFGAFTRRDVISVLQFGALTFIVLPLLPDRDMGPYAAVNPYQAWLVVVLVAGVSLAGYVGLRLFGQRYGAPLVAAFGGLVSSTATSLLFARQARQRPASVDLAAVVTLIANGVVFLRLGALAAVMAPDLLLPLLPVLAGGLLGGGLVAMLRWRAFARTEAVTTPEIANPTELHVSLGFGALFVAVSVASAWLSATVGASGLYALAFVSGLTDVDAITLATFKLHGTAGVNASVAVTAIAIALCANLALKSVLVWSVGGAALARRCLPGFAASAIGLLAVAATLRGLGASG